MQTPPTAQIQFKKIQFPKFSIESNNLSEDSTQGSPNLNFSFERKKDDEHTNFFWVNFNIKIHNETFSLKVFSTALFTNSEEITDEFLNSDFAKFNAPAIAFPFLRAFVAQIILAAGFHPIILPAFNFYKLAEIKP